MPMIPLEDLHQDVKPGDTITMTVKAVKDGMAEMDYNNIEVEGAEAAPVDESAMSKMPAPKMRKAMVKMHGEADAEGY